MGEVTQAEVRRIQSSIDARVARKKKSETLFMGILFCLISFFCGFIVGSFQAPKKVVKNKNYEEGRVHSEQHRQLKTKIAKKVQKDRTTLFGR